ncbi:uncharacterized protein LOC111122898 [Crassostrea virginica]
MSIVTTFCRLTACFYDRSLYCCQGACACSPLNARINSGGLIWIGSYRMGEMLCREYPALSFGVVSLCSADNLEAAAECVPRATGQRRMSSVMRYGWTNSQRDGVEVRESITEGSQETSSVKINVRQPLS